MQLSEEEKGVLLLGARDSIRSLFGQNKPPFIDYNYYTSLAQVGSGAFVTLTIRNRLRGCIGYITSPNTLFDTVCDAAKQAAVNDPRFYPLKEEEVNSLNIEISILSPLMPIANYEQIEIGKHGLVLDEPGIRALLLPQVAVENNFDLPGFLTALCEKAGIAPFEWKNRQLNIKVFTAIVFSESEKRKKTYEQN
jgi:AmmeMemoRadiSam system protein A